MLFETTMGIGDPHFRSSINLKAGREISAFRSRCRRLILNRRSEDLAEDGANFS
jgi:hypothetical protein